jgi:hypothetical protein
LPALAFLVVVRALCALFLRSFAACPATAHSFFILLLLSLVAFLGQWTLSLLHSLLFAFAWEAALLVLSFFLFLVLAPRPTSLSAQLLSCCLAPSIARVAIPTFLTHFLVSMPDPDLKLSEARTSLDSFLLLLHLLDLPHDGRHLALLSRQIASFAIPPQLFVPVPLSLIKLWVRCLSSLWLRAVVVGGVVRVGPAALVAHYRLRAHHVSTVSMDYFVLDYDHRRH